MLARCGVSPIPRRDVYHSGARSSCDFSGRAPTPTAGISSPVPPHTTSQTSTLRTPRASPTPWSHIDGTLFAGTTTTSRKFPTPSPTLVGISGYARSGKDSLAAALVARHGFTRIAFADKVRELTAALHADTADLAERVGWDEAKADPLVRRRLQDVGLAVRRILGEGAWVDAALRHLVPAARYVVTDVRLRNDAATFRARGGLLVRIVRPGVGPADDHPSERDLDGWNDWYVVVRNDGTLADLED